MQLTADALKTRLHDTKEGLTANHFMDLADSIATAPLRLQRTLVPLTATGQTTLFTVPTGYKAVVFGANVYGNVLPTGSAKVSNLKIGTTANSYAEVLGLYGHDFNTSQTYTLLPVAAQRYLALQHNVPRLLSKTNVLLTAVAQTNLYTVPTGATARINEVILEGVTAQSGGTSSKLLIGTTGASYVELLNGATGHTFISGTATSLLAAGARFSSNSIYPASMSLSPVMDFAAASVIKADVSGTVVTAGAVSVELWGNLNTDGPQVFTAGSVIKADVSGSALVTTGSVYTELIAQLIPSE